LVFVESTRAWAAAALMAAAVTGCGGGDQEKAVRSAVDGWIAAVVRHDDAAACARLSNDLRRQLARHLLGEGVKGSCRTWAAKYVSPRHPASQRAARITAIRIHGPRATVSLTAPGVPAGTATLVRERGGWRIDNY
jgi:hypothetical protein